MADTTLVLELQRDAMDRSVRVSDLLRKALLVARKLGIEEFGNWAEAELEGYMDQEEVDVPPYRFARGQPRMQDRLGRWIPIHFPDSETSEMFSRRSNGQPIGQLEAMIEGREDHPTILMPYNVEIQSMLMKSVGEEGQAGLFLQCSDILGILDAVRTAVLKWTIRLEKEGILGKGMTFTDSERQKAADIPQSVNYFFGPSAVQQGSQSEMTAIAGVQKDQLKTILADIASLLPDAGLPEDDSAAAQADLSSIQQQLDSPRPNRSAVRSLLGSIGGWAKKGGEKAASIAIEKLADKALKGEF